MCFFKIQNQVKLIYGVEVRIVFNWGIVMSGRGQISWSVCRLHTGSLTVYVHMCSTPQSKVY